MHLSTKVLVNLIGKVGATGAGTATMVLIAILLGPAPLGIYALVIAVSVWAVLPVGAVAGGIEKRTSESDDGGYLTAGVLLGGAIAAPLLAGLALASPYLESYTGASAWFVVVVTAARAIGSVSGSCFIARGRADLKGLLDGVYQLVRLGAVGVALASGWGLDGVLIAHAVAEGGVWAAALVAYSGRLKFETPTIRHGTSLLEYARHFWLNIIRLQGFAWTDTLVLGAFVAPTFVGVYEIGWRMARVLSLVSKSIKQATLPEISTEDESGAGTDRLRSVTADALVYPGLLAIPGFVGALILGGVLFTLFGEQFQIPGAGAVLALLVAAELIATYADQLILALYAGNRTREAFRLNGVVMGTNIVLNIILVYGYGWIGAAVATLVASGVSLAFGYWRFGVSIGRPEVPLVDIRDQALAALAMGGGLLAIESQLHIASRQTVLFAVGLGAIVYFGVLVTVNSRIRRTIATVTADLRAAVFE